MLMTWTRRTVIGALLVTATVVPAAATETIKAVVIDGYPARALWVHEFTNFFIPQVDKRLAETGNYAMDWQESYGGTKLGLGDIGIVTTIFHSSPPASFWTPTSCFPRIRSQPSTIYAAPRSPGRA